MIKSKIASGKKNQHGRPHGKKKGKHLTKKELAAYMAKMIPDDEMI